MKSKFLDEPVDMAPVVIESSDSGLVVQYQLGCELRYLRRQSRQ